MGAANRPRVPARFELIDRVGQGGMATVWRALDTTTQTEVALKILMPHLRENVLVVERFKREIAAVRRISHPNVIEIYDLVETDDVLALVEELHPGRDLKRIIRLEGRLAPARIVQIGKQVLDALAAAHEVGIIHRDIKPHNILVDDTNRVKITDFGLARVDDLVRVTSHTMPFGSPEYVAPELLESPYADPRADLYSVGVTLFEALSGKPPFRASTPFELVRMHQSQPPVKVPEGIEAEDEGLIAAIERSLAKNPEDRFATASEMKAMLTGRARVADALAKPREWATCLSCDTQYPSFLPSCLSCGHRPIHIHANTRRGKQLLLTNPTSWERELTMGAQLTYDREQALVTALEALGASLPAPYVLSQRLRKLPLVIAKDLSDEEATTMVDFLHSRGLKHVRAVTPRLAFTETRWPVYPVLFALIPFLIGVVLRLGRPGFIFTSAILLFLFFPFFFIRWYVKSSERARPICETFAVPSKTLTDARFERARRIYGKATTPRLRELLQRTLQRTGDVRTTLSHMEDEPQASKWSTELDAVLERFLIECEIAADIESNLQLLDTVELTERIETLEERIRASETIVDTEALIEQKQEVVAILEDVDYRHQALGESYGRLLLVASEIARLAEATNPGPALDDEAVEELRDTKGGVEAVLEVERLAGSP